MLLRPTHSSTSFGVAAGVLFAIGCSASKPGLDANGDAPTVLVDAAAASQATDAGPTPDPIEDAAADVREASVGPVGDTCDNPTFVEMNDVRITLDDQTTGGLANDYSGRRTCMRGEGRDHVYAVTVPPKKQLSALLESFPGFNQLVEIVVGDASRCAAISSKLETPGSTCAVGADRGLASGTDLVSYYNATDLPTNAFIIVDAVEDKGPGGDYRLSLTVDTPPPGDACENAERIGEGVLSAQSIVGYGNNYSNDTEGKKLAKGCKGAAGPERVYAIDVPPSTKLTIAVTPAGLFDSTVNIVVGDVGRCNAVPRFCDASNDDGAEYERDEASYVNSTTLTVTAFVMIDTYHESAAGTFSLEARLTPVSTNSITSTTTDH